MKLLTFLDGNFPRFGAEISGYIVDFEMLSRTFSQDDPQIKRLPASGERFFDQLDELMPSARAVVARFAQSPYRGPGVHKRGEVTLLPPISRPPKIICVARNYAEHAREAGLEISPIPILFARFANTLIGEGATIRVPSVSNSLDWEGELAVIIGKPTNGKRISKAEAMDYVFGYSIFNDVTVRDFQFRVTQYTAGKNFRTSGPFGPHIVTADEIPDPHNLDIKTVLNGKVEQSANTNTMIYDIPTILEHIAEFIDLEPGDVIPTGTPAGVGFKRKPPVFLKDGDTISVEVSGIGRLTNRVRNEEAIK